MDPYVYRQMFHTPLIKEGFLATDGGCYRAPRLVTHRIYVWEMEAVRELHNWSHTESMSERWSALSDTSIGNSLSVPKAYTT